MTERSGEKLWLRDIFGNDNRPKNLQRKVGASIYHALVLHPNKLIDEKRMGKLLSGLISKEDLQLVKEKHRQHE